MAQRSLTDVFLLMRNNAIRSRQIYPEQVSQFFLSCNKTQKSLAFRMLLKECIWCRWTWTTAPVDTNECLPFGSTTGKKPK